MASDQCYEDSCLLFSHYLHHFNFPVSCKGNSPHPLYRLITIANILYKKKNSWMSTCTAGTLFIYVFTGSPEGSDWCLNHRDTASGHHMLPSKVPQYNLHLCVTSPPNNPCKGVGQAGWTLSALVAIDALVIRNNVWEWTPNTVYTYISTARSGIRTHASPWDFNLNTVMFNFGDFNNSTHLPSSYNFISLYCML